MKFKHLLIHLIALCLGIFIYVYMTNEPMIRAVESSYWCVFGGIFVWFKMSNSD